jgi:membrane protein YqaA with SNARE-associated domain
MLFAAVISIWTYLRRWGGVGLFVLGIVDSSPIPTFGSLDAFTAILAARHKDLWLYYALMSVLGSLVGAYSTYRLGHSAGQTGLEKRFKATRLRQVQRAFDYWGFGAVFVPSVIPPPFPTILFFIAAGAFEYPLKKYFLAVTLGRTVRYLALAYIGAHFGRHVLRFFRHPQQYMAATLAISLAVLALVIAITVAWRSLQDEAARG